MDGTLLHAAEQRRLEWEARELARDSEPDSCHWRVSGPPAEISNTPAYQVLCGQAVHEQVERSKWAMVEAVLIDAKERLEACAQSYEGRRRAMLIAKAIEFNSAIGSADASKKAHEVELERIRAEQKRIVDEFYRSEE
jgi:hypothetical protein